MGVYRSMRSSPELGEQGEKWCQEHVKKLNLDPLSAV